MASPIGFAEELAVADPIGFAMELVQVVPTGFTEALVLVDPIGFVKVLALVHPKHSVIADSVDFVDDEDSSIGPNLVLVLEA